MQAYNHADTWLVVVVVVYCVLLLTAFPFFRKIIRVCVCVRVRYFIHSISSAPVVAAAAATTEKVH